MLIIQRKYNEENFCGVRKHFLKKKKPECVIFSKEMMILPIQFGSSARTLGE